MRVANLVLELYYFGFFLFIFIYLCSYPPTKDNFPGANICTLLLFTMHVRQARAGGGGEWGGSRGGGGRHGLTLSEEEQRFLLGVINIL